MWVLGAKKTTKQTKRKPWKPETNENQRKQGESKIPSDTQKERYTDGLGVWGMMNKEKRMKGKEGEKIAYANGGVVFSFFLFFDGIYLCRLF